MRATLLLVLSDIVEVPDHPVLKEIDCAVNKRNQGELIPASLEVFASLLELHCCAFELTFKSEFKQED